MISADLVNRSVEARHKAVQHSALALVAIRLDALAILVLRHFLTSLLYERTHNKTSKSVNSGALACLFRAQEAN